MQSLADETLDDIATQQDRHGDLERNAQRNRKRGHGMMLSRAPKWKLQMNGQRGRSKPAPVTLAKVT